MNEKKFAVVFGTRPEAIKLAPVIRELEARNHHVVKISTGQHQSLLQQALNYFEIGVDYELGAMRKARTLPELLSRIVADSDKVLRKEAPDVVIVQGDTATALGSGLAAYMGGMQVAHIEAGLRTYDDENPFPEEANRSMLARVAHWHFCPTETARKNLLSEGIDPARIQVTGNTIVDALQWGRTKAKALHRSAGDSRNRLTRMLNVSHKAAQRFALVTSHRRENFGRPLADICSAVCELQNRRSDLRIIWPVHLNPHVRTQLEQLLSRCGRRLMRVRPLGYETMLNVLEACAFIMTDSGGIQEEAAVFHKPVLIMRKATERPEILQTGGGMLVGTTPGTIVEAATRLLDDESFYRAMSSAPNPFGDGRAAERIAGALLQ
ncbi:MAG TPA: UDP-N-acetylglucosamine 2-epimerase (non-hydrolyzing) [Thermoanaerobaculia bacterium]|nr:UDP-N-acetylglucosamine 2-epimerase (non-hydrolyzing) [Thermoanaerobaculia bacterium]